MEPRQYFMMVVPGHHEFIPLGTELGNLVSSFDGDFLVEKLAVPVPIRNIDGTSHLKMPLEDERTHKENVKTSSYKARAIIKDTHAHQEQVKAAYKKATFIKETRAQVNTEILRMRLLRAQRLRLSRTRPALMPKSANSQVQPKVVSGDKVLKTSSKPISQDHGLLRILDMPAELQMQVMTYWDEKEFVPFCLASPATSRRARVVVEERYESTFGTWAGKRIACLGEWTDPGDYPTDFFDDDLKKSVQKAVKIDQITNEDMDGDDEEDPPYLWCAIHDKFKRAEKKETKLPEVFSSAYTESDADFLVKISDEQKIIKLPLPESKFFPNHHVWILRNLTTNEFVRPEAVARKPNMIHGPFIEEIGFGHVVMLRTCWSSDEEVGFDDVEGVHRGSWAGHAFDITTFERHNEEVARTKKVWTDVSDQIFNELWRVRQDGVFGDYFSPRALNEGYDESDMLKEEPDSDSEDEVRHFGHIGGENKDYSSISDLPDLEQHPDDTFGVFVNHATNFGIYEDDDM